MNRRQNPTRLIPWTLPQAGIVALIGLATFVFGATQSYSNTVHNVIGISGISLFAAGLLTGLTRAVLIRIYGTANPKERRQAKRWRTLLKWLLGITIFIAVLAIPALQPIAPYLIIGSIIIPLTIGIIKAIRDTPSEPTQENRYVEQCFDCGTPHDGMPLCGCQERRNQEEQDHVDHINQQSNIFDPYNQRNNW